MDPARDRRVTDEFGDLGVRRLRTGDGPLPADLSPFPATVVKSPGIRPDAPVLVSAAAAGAAVIDEAELGWLLDPRPYVGVTGTNGKSTSCELIRSILSAVGTQALIAGNTHFGPPLSTASEHAADIVIAELSSFQLEGCADLLPDVGLFTNITHDHIYRHGTFAEYGACKRRAFIRGDRTVQAAAVGVDETFGAELADDLEERGVNVVRFGESGRSERRLLNVTWSLDRARVEVTEGSGRRVLETHLPGRHNALNVVGALALGDALQIDPETAAAAIEATGKLPGRMERIAGPDGREAVVDYAHNGAGVAHTLRTARAAMSSSGTRGRLIVVVSSLDFVDEQHGFNIGAAAARHADFVVLTTQRARSIERFDKLAPGLLAGASSVGLAPTTVEFDRRTAIRLALAEAVPGDLTLVLDRGASAGPLIDANGVSAPFDDRQVVRQFFGILDDAAVTS
jgi:UDP-N-acetylmuramoylalanine-D-glutamate ligase